jgi:serine/threonine protein kinase
MKRHADTQRDWGHWADDVRVDATALPPGTVVHVAAREDGPEPARYIVEERLGRGGSGVVYRARTASGERVAVKVLAQADRATFQRFVREANTTASIPHRHVVRLIDFGVDFATNLPFLVMEYLEGNDLSARLKQGKRLATDVALRIARDVALALAAAHAAGVLHRDMNIFLAVEGDAIVVKVLDFGIAKVAALGALTADDTVLGTPHYLSPEQIRNPKVVGVRSDIWSLGVVLYRMLVGQTPHHGAESTVDVMLRVWNDPVPELAVIAPWVPAPVATMVRGLLRRNPDLRPATMAAVIAQLEACLKGSPRKDSPLTDADLAPLAAPDVALVATAPAAPNASRRRKPREVSWSLAFVVIAALLSVAAAIALYR